MAIQLFYRFIAAQKMTATAAKTHVAKLLRGEIVEDRWEVDVGDRVLNLVDLCKKDLVAVDQRRDQRPSHEVPRAK